MGRVYAVASGKGGVGKTTTTANLGAALARAGHETVVVDADLGMANLAAALGVDDDGPTLHDVLAGEAAVADAIREVPDRPAVLPGSRDLDDFAGASPEGLAAVLGTLADEYEHVVVDTGAGLSTDSLEPLRAADEVVLVSTPDPAALDDTAKTAAVTRRLGTPLRGYVVVRARGEAIERARDRLDGEVLGTIPDDPAVTDALAAGMPLAEYAPRSPATGAYRRLAVALTGVTVPEADVDHETETGTGETPTTPDLMERSPDPADPVTEPAADAAETADPGPESTPVDPDRDDEAGDVAFDAQGAPDPDDGPGDPDEGTGVLVEPAEGDRSGEKPAELGADTAVEDPSDPETAPGDADDDGVEDADGPSPDEGVGGENGDGTAGTGDETDAGDAGTGDAGTEDGDEAETGDGGGGVAADDPDEVTIEGDEGEERANDGERDGAGEESDDRPGGRSDGEQDDTGAGEDTGADGSEGQNGSEGNSEEKKGFLRRLFG